MLMNRPGTRRRVTIAAITALCVIAALVIPFPLPADAAATPRTHDITVDARAFAYTPATIDVRRGDTINLTLQSVDAAHGLSVDGYDVNLQAEPGQSGHATFVADKDGTFKFRCSITCGPLHPFMIGELRVDPQFPLVRALLALGAAALGAIMFFWKGV